MLYTVYKTTNVLNDNFYIGVHKTNLENDSYLGSGKVIKLAIKKYGRANFKKEVLFIFNNIDEAFQKEKDLLKIYLTDEKCYNIAYGGKDGALHLVNDLGLNVLIQEQRLRNPQVSILAIEKGRDALKILREDKTSEWSKRYRENLSKSRIKSGHSSFKNLCKDEAFQLKRKIAFKKNNHAKGDKNSQHGTIWITNGEKNKKIKKDSLIPEGWRRGRTFK